MPSLPLRIALHAFKAVQQNVLALERLGNTVCNACERIFRFSAGNAQRARQICLQTAEQCTAALIFTRSTERMTLR